MILDGLWNGLKAKFEQIKGWWQGVSGWFGSAFQKGNEIHSPSRLFQRFGGFITEGLHIGLSKGTPKPLSTIGTLAGNLQRRFTERAGELRSNLSARMQANSVEFAAARAQQQSAQAAQHGGNTFHYSPQIHAPGGDVNQIAELLKMSQRDFERRLEQYFADKARRSYA